MEITLILQPARNDVKVGTFRAHGTIIEHCKADKGTFKYHTTVF